MKDRNKNEREHAVDIILKITEDKSYNNLALKDVFIKNSGLSNMQKNFITEVVNGTLRHLIYIDYILNCFSNIKTEKMKPVILSILRTAVYQIKFMDKTPAYAVCDEAAKLARKRGFGLTGFVNGVLRAVVRKAHSISPTDVSIIYSFPEWLVNYWLDSYDNETVEKICASLNKRPETSVCVNTLKTNAGSFLAKLENIGVSASKGELSQNALYVSGMSDITKNVYYNDGLFNIMGEASMKAVEILDPAPGSFLIDVCAAPGGKSLYAAMLMKNKGEILSCDIYGHKLKFIEKSSARLGISIIKTGLKDACEAEYPPADYIIIDAPCSGFGLIRKKPDIKYTRALPDIASLVILQKKIISNVSRYLKKGGILVYSTCTISKEENEGIAEWFTLNFSFKLLESIEILPYIYNTDGFYIAKFSRL